jgi:hypothetical protein
MGNGGIIPTDNSILNYPDSIKNKLDQNKQGRPYVGKIQSISKKSVTYSHLSLSSSISKLE